MPIWPKTSQHSTGESRHGYTEMLQSCTLGKLLTMYLCLIMLYFYLIYKLYLLFVLVTWNPFHVIGTMPPKPKLANDKRFCFPKMSMVFCFLFFLITKVCFLIFFLKAHFHLSNMFCVLISYGEILFPMFICLLTKYFNLLTPATLSVSLQIWWPLLYRLCDSCHCILDWFFFNFVSLHMAWPQSRRQKNTLKASPIQCFHLSKNHFVFFLYFSKIILIT